MILHITKNGLEVGVQSKTLHNVKHNNVSELSTFLPIWRLPNMCFLADLDISLTSSQKIYFMKIDPTPLHPMRGSV